VASNTATAVATTLIGAACGLMGGLALGNRSNQPGSQGTEAVAPQQSASAPFDSSAIESRLEEVQRGLAELRSLVAGQASRSDRTPIVADSPAGATSEPAADSSDHDRLRAIELELTAIRQTIKEQVWIQSPPTFEQIRRAPQSPIWSEVNGLCRLASQDAGAAKETILGLSYEQVLTRFGRPTDIQPAKWWYSALGHSGFNLNFVNGYVGGISILQ
jgi:hypothetical protein